MPISAAAAETIRKMAQVDLGDLIGCINLNAMLCDVLGKPPGTQILADTHDEWRRLNDAE